MHFRSIFYIDRLKDNKIGNFLINFLIYNIKPSFNAFLFKNFQYYRRLALVFS